MKHWSFLFSYLVAPKGTVGLFVCLFFFKSHRILLHHRFHRRVPASSLSSGHWHFLPQSAHLVFGRDFMLSIFLLQSRTNFSSMPNFRLAAELLELSDANLTTCNLKLTEYFIRFTFDNILLHVRQAKKTNREVRRLALPVLFSQLELIYT